MAAFGARSTTDEVLAGLNLRGKYILVTGVSSGLGSETARSLVAHGADVVGTARNLQKGAEATAAIGQDGPGSFRLVELDLSSLESVRSCADLFLAAGRPMDAIIANAGAINDELAYTRDGFEMQFGSNHLGHFVLINRLVPLLGPGARVVSLSSSSHYVADVDLDDPNFTRTPYDSMVSYGRSKTANILFAVEFDRRHRDRGVRATALHPGGIRTGFQGNMQPGELDAIVEQMNLELAAEGKPLFEFKTIEQGAATSVWAAIVADGEDVGGRYCEDCHVSEISDGVINASAGGVRAYALDPERARQLWALSEDLVGERF